MGVIITVMKPTNNSLHQAGNTPVNPNRRKLIGAGIAAALGLGAEYDTTHTGAGLEVPDPAPHYPRLPAPEAWVESPASREPLITFLLLCYADTKGDIAKVTADGIMPQVRYHADDARTEAYWKTTTSPVSAQPLGTMTIRDPAKPQDPAATLTFRMVASHRDAATDFNAMAYYHAGSKTMLCIFPGVGNGHDLLDLASTLRGEANPQTQGVESFMRDVQRQVAVQHLDVKHATFMGHSIGADSTITALAMTANDPALVQTLGGTMPRGVLVEDWYAADTIKRVADTPEKVAMLESQISTVRHYPATFIGVAENPPIGTLVALIARDRDPGFHSGFSRQDDHRAIRTAERLFFNQDAVVKEFGGKLQATELFQYPANWLVRVAAQAIGHPAISGAAVAGAAAVKGLQVYNKRRAENSEGLAAPNDASAATPCDFPQRPGNSR